MEEEMEAGAAARARDAQGRQVGGGERDEGERGDRVVKGMVTGGMA